MRDTLTYRELGGHELGWQVRGAIRALLRLGAVEWRAYCNTCGATGPWRPGRPNVLTQVEHPEVPQ